MDLEEMKRIAEDAGLAALRGRAWTCHVCGQVRSDEFISVAKHKHIFPGGFEMEMNVRYCNDRESCRAAAMLRDHFALANARLQLQLERRRRELERAEARRKRAFVASVIGFTASSVGLVSIVIGHLH